MGTRRQHLWRSGRCAGRRSSAIVWLGQASDSVGTYAVRAHAGREGSHADDARLAGQLTPGHRVLAEAALCRWACAFRRQAALQIAAAPQVTRAFLRLSRSRRTRAGSRNLS